jgi:hypothetical protein
MARVKDLDARLQRVAPHVPFGIQVATEWTPGDAPLPPGTISLEDAERLAEQRERARPPERVGFHVERTEDGGTKAVLDWRQDQRRIIAVQIGFAGPGGAVATGPERLLYELMPGEQVVIRTVTPPERAALTLAVDGVIEF